MTSKKRNLRAILSDAEVKTESKKKKLNVAQEGAQVVPFDFLDDEEPPKKKKKKKK